MSAFGSAMFRSPSIAYDAVTPPVVGIGHDRDVRDPRLAEARERGGDLAPSA
jgi:hypothetical protein